MSSGGFVPDSDGYNIDVMSYGELEDLAEVSNDGLNNDRTEVGVHPDGMRVYAKDAELWMDDGVQSHIAADIFLQEIDYPTPRIAYDDNFGKILVEEMPGEATDDWPEEQLPGLHTSAAQKMLLGDMDYQGNFVSTNSTVSAIDFDSTGRDLITAKKTLETSYGDKLNSELLHREASRTADEIDTDRMERRMRNEEYLMNNWGTEEYDDPTAWSGLFYGSIENIVDNVEAFKRI